ncbi:hypothetical protein U1Q18_052624 [Sarracenia purpurea var. burkii]
MSQRTSQEVFREVPAWVSNDQCERVFQEAAKTRLDLLEMVRGKSSDRKDVQTILSTVKKLEIAEERIKGSSFDLARLAKLEARIFRLNKITDNYAKARRAYEARNAVEAESEDGSGKEGSEADSNGGETDSECDVSVPDAATGGSVLVEK